MPFKMGRSGGLVATLSFYGLIGLGFGLLVALSGFASFFAPVYNTCRTLGENIWLRLSSPAVLLPGLLAGGIVSIVTVALIRQWRSTRRVLQTLAGYQIPVPPRLAQIAEEVGLAGRVDCVAADFTTPFCYGFVQPRVCVPAVLLDLLSDAELRAVLRHERYHAVHHDPLKIWLSRALAHGFFFLPLARELRDSYLVAKEVAADESTAQGEGLALASALVKMLQDAEVQLAPDSGFRELSAAAFSHLSLAGLIHVSREPSQQTAERIRCLIDGRPIAVLLPSWKSVVGSIAIVLGIFVASYSSLHAATSWQEGGAECPPETIVREVEFEAWNGAVPLVGEQNLVTVPVLEQVPDGSAGLFDCDLLVPSCRQADSGAH